jgi:two-component system, cell cycle sensor histidine kinase and response regulator CckA
MPQPVTESQARAVKAGLIALFLMTTALWFSSRTLLATNFLPHWYCYVGNARLLWTNVISDLMIGISYVVISATLAQLVRRAGRDLPYTGFFWAFGLFIVSCGGTHFLEVVTVWKPVYWLSAAVKVVTAVASAGTAVVLVVAADDIVDFVRTAREAAARRGNEQFRTLINAAPMAVVGADLEGKVTAWNPAAERLYGWASGEAVGNLLSLVPPEGLEDQAEVRRRIRAGEMVIGHETLRMHRNGQVFPVSISAAPLLDGSGEVTGLMSIATDISERRLMEFELREKTEEQKHLETQVRQAQKMEVLGRLAGGVAHDFNNMLMVLGGCTELLDRSLPGESPARIYLDQIQRTTEKATAITKQLLAFSRKQVMESRPMDLNEALTESEFMLPRLLGSDIELTFQHDAVQSWILSDPGQIEQVIANLAINSRDAMPEGGRLTIFTRNATQLPENEAEDAAAPLGWVVMEVADSGCGMDEKTRAQIFEPFFTTKPAGKGTGLGLATVYGIVKQSHGHICVESSPGNGTRFQIFFPAIEAPLDDKSATTSSEMPDQSSSDGTILIADDQAALRHAVVEILRTSGYKVLESESSMEALEMARQYSGKIDILLTDIVMPGLRGPELARRITKVQPEIQVVYMSGYAEDFPEAQLPPNSVFLQKPFRFATLLEQLKLVRRKA